MAYASYNATTAVGAGSKINSDCVPGLDSIDCIAKIEKGEADLVTLDGGHTFTAGMA